jgi:hypothetical protein
MKRITRLISSKRFGQPQTNHMVPTSKVAWNHRRESAPPKWRLLKGMAPDSAREFLGNWKIAGGLLCLLVLSGLGPVVMARWDIRPEHISVYLLPLVVGLFNSRRVFAASSKNSWKYPSGLFMANAIWVGIVILIQTQMDRDRMLVIRQLQNGLKPVAVMFTVAMLLPEGRREGMKVISLVVAAFVLGLCANTALEVASLFIDTSQLIGQFAATDWRTGVGLWMDSATLGRTTGIFTQPLEAGFAYSVGAVAAIGLLKAGLAVGWNREILRAGLPVMLLGGVLCLSKVFLGVGLPIALWLLLTHKTGRKSVKQMGPITLIFWVLLLLLAAKSLWSKLDNVQGYIENLTSWDQSSSFIETITAGRFGAETHYVQSIFREVAKSAPVMGYGPGTMEAFDCEYLVFFVQGGIVSLAFYFLILALLGWYGFRIKKINNELGRAYLGLTVLIVLAAWGGPALTVNRSFIMLWFLLAAIPMVLEADVRRGRR